MKHATTKELFDFINKRVVDIANSTGIPSFSSIPSLVCGNVLYAPGRNVRLGRNG